MPAYHACRNPAASGSGLVRKRLHSTNPLARTGTPGVSIETCDPTTPAARTGGETLSDSLLWSGLARQSAADTFQADPLYACRQVRFWSRCSNPTSEESPFDRAQGST